MTLSSCIKINNVVATVRARRNDVLYLAEGYRVNTAKKKLYGRNQAGRFVAVKVNI